MFYACCIAKSKELKVFNLNGMQINLLFYFLVPVYIQNIYQVNR